MTVMMMMMMIGIDMFMAGQSLPLVQQHRDMDMAHG